MGGKFILDEFQKISVAVQTERKEPEETEEEKLISDAFETAVKAVPASLERATQTTPYYPEVKTPLATVDKAPKPTSATVAVQTDLSFLPMDDEDLAFSDDDCAFEKEEPFVDNNEFNCMSLCKINSQIHSSELKVYLACSPPGRVKTKFITEILHKNNNNYNKKKTKKICNKKNTLAV